MKKKLKLFAVGDNTPDLTSDNVIQFWSAETKTQALNMAGHDKNYPIVQINMTEPRLIFSVPKYIDPGFLEDELI